MSTTAVRGQTATGGAKGAPAAEAAAEAPAKAGRKKLFLILLVGVVVAAGAAWFFLLRPAGEEAEEHAAPVAGEVVVLDPISVNLAGGHYLKVGMALQLVEEATHFSDGSKALDVSIDLLSGMDMAELAATEQRQAVKAELVTRISEAYEGDVMDVYFTEFVMQ